MREHVVGGDFMVGGRIRTLPEVEEGGGEMELVKALEEWGCFRVVNHGVPAELMSEMKAVTAAIFDLPDEIHTPTTYTKYGMGYIRRGLINPFFESLSINDISSPEGFIHKLDGDNIQYIKAIRNLAGFLGRKLMEGHGLAGDLFEGWFYQLRMNKYHFSPESVGSLGSDLHSDPSFLTILQDDENLNGLQVVDKFSGEFVPVDHIPGSLVVNAGDIGKVWSNGRYYNVNHKVCCLKPTIRSSIAFFMLAPTDQKIEAPSELVDSDHPRCYVPLDYKEYRKTRMLRGEITGGVLDLFNSTPN
ncbi:hypothetical protein E3N88_27606 [Mikania micrantha]|uniref:Fe2OG dioxygenase domain-containing protein n=1 Tax=Mikania micrantha TaxID=192012 RepID=A0A5N6MZY2_9ASTR|nr:hypothetical protein E3N88_27606 [Mikania micrantha]